MTATLSATLRYPREVDDAIDRLRRLGLTPHPDVPEKSWDMALALESIVRDIPKQGRILDVGARWSPIIERLEMLGYQDIWACDLERSWKDDLRRLARRSKVRFRQADLTDTGLPPGSFDGITSMSVIEHGVEPGAYFAEMARLLRPGGLLITSTDFWCEPVTTDGIFPYGPRFGQMRVFGPDDINELLAMAARAGLRFDGDLDLRCAERVVTWRRVARSYTFTYFELRRE
jgi:SAM-dependent methyltransferase